ncbi:hypothetical protein D3C80_1231290 [compost metagenome]
MKSKFLKIFTLALAMYSGITNAQIKTNNAASATIIGESVFLDASSFTSANIGKGLNFPRTNLTTFTFVSGTTSALKFPTAYDGLVVYNTGTGTTITGTPVAVTPGFYYFKNTGATTNSTTGVWTPIGSSSAVDIKTSETATNTSVNGSQVYGIKGSFAATGTSAFVSVAVPAGMTGLYKMTIFKPGGSTVFATGVQTFNIASSTNNVVTGEGMITQVYPAGTYDYVLEYFK